MNRHKSPLCGLLIILILGGVTAQAQTPFLLKKVQIKGISPEASFSSLAQDDDGFLWIGSLSGLYRYDGTRVVRYLRDPSDSNSITHNYANTLAKDASGNVWIGTFGGFINFYERQTGKISRIEPSIKSLPRVIVIKTRPGLDSQTMIAAGTQCMYRISGDGRVIDSAFLFHNQIRIADFLEYEPGKFIIAAGSLFLFDWRTKRLQPLQFGGPPIEYKCIEINTEGKICIGSNKGIITLSPGSFQISSKPDTSVKNVKCLKKDKRGRMWIGSSAGLFVKEKGQIQKVVSPDSTVKPTEINDVFVDASETVWIATENNGLYQAYTPSLLFRQIPEMQRYSQKSLIQSIVEEKPGVWLIGTIAGVFRYSFLSHTFEKIKLSDNQQQVSVYCQLKDKKGGLWIGTTSLGLLYQPAGAKDFIWFKHNPTDENTIPSNNVSALQEDEKGRIWIGTFNRGRVTNSVCYYDANQKVFKRIKTKPGDPNYLNAVSISQIETKGNQMWIGTWDNGLYGYRLSGTEPPQNTFTNYAENSNGSGRVSHNVVSCVRLTKNGKVWFGTVSGGLNVLHTKNDSVRWYTVRNGLPGNLIYRIEEDDQGILWISTDNGISRFDPASESFINYNMSSGLPSENFAFLSSSKCSDGTIIFGTNDGRVVYFNPNAYKNTSNLLPTVIADIRLSNKSVLPAEASILQKVPYLTDTIALTHDQSVISFDLANMDFINPENYTYAYKLEGFDKDWLYITDRNSITYTNLDPGTYTLFAKNANHSGIWNETPTKLVLIVKPPYWKTWWFRTLVVLAIASGIYLLYRYRLQQKIRIFAVRQRLHRDLHDDVGATLSSVKAYSEILGNNGNSRIISNLIKENAADMIDRLEVISWATNPSHDNFKSLTDAMLKFARPLMHAHGINLQFTKSGVDEKLTIPGDIRQNLLLIFKEAVNNILKYAEATECGINVLIKNGKLVLEIKDNGKGADGIIKGGGSGLKNMYKRAEEMAGTIEMETTSGNGTTIRVTIPHPFKIPITWYPNRQAN